MKPIRKVLVANRGEIARRIFRACRALGFETVAVYADPDREAPFVREADEAVYIGSPVTGGSFLAFDAILHAAALTGADAVHPGYGFLAENADFAEACERQGLCFVGPPVAAIRAMGTKIEAKTIAQNAGVPIIPGFSAAGLSDEEIVRKARQLRFPLLVKASAGGGGKGMRRVDSPEALAAALAPARREAQAAFGDDTLLIERYIEHPRHIEIQIFGDQHGNIVHLFERECSIQRRYQKIIEEAPSPFVNDVLRERMGAAAVALARSLGYYSAGTVELVVDRDGNFYFLEVNTRLQVEHPVTEEITGIDLVQLQFSVAQGEPLPFAQEDLCISGHAIEARLYAEDPEHDFLPSTGTLAVWQPRPGIGVRYESGVEAGCAVTIHYDPMLAKIIARGSHRTQAIRRLRTALASLRVHGVRTNRDFLLAILDHPEFAAGATDTHFIPRHFPTFSRHQAGQTDRLHALAAALWEQAERRRSSPVLRSLPSGWRNNPSQRQWCEYATGADTVRVEYRVLERGEVEALVNGAPHNARIVSADGAGIALEVDQVRRYFEVVAQGEWRYVDSVLGSSALRELPRFPEPQSERVEGGCSAPMPGRIIDVRVRAGDRVHRGDVLVILEAMKMEHEVRAPTDGVVREVRVEVGQQVEAGSLLVVLEETTSEEGRANE